MKGKAGIIMLSVMSVVLLIVGRLSYQHVAIEQQQRSDIKAGFDSTFGILTAINNGKEYYLTQEEYQDILKQWQADRDTLVVQMQPIIMENPDTVEIVKVYRDTLVVHDTVTVYVRVEEAQNGWRKDPRRPGR